MSAARAIIGQCAFNKTACEAGLDGLGAWEYEWNEDLQTFSREPLHNWASHPGDAFAYGCQVMQGLAVKRESKPKPQPKGSVVLPGAPQPPSRVRIRV